MAGLLPEAVDVGGRRQALLVAGRHAQQRHRQRGRVARRVRRADGLVDDLADLVEAAAHDGDVVLHDARALAAELGLELLLDRAEQLLLAQAGVLAHLGGGEERALEGVALHAQLQLGAAGLLAGDLERVEVEDADLVVDDLLLRPARERGPGALAQVALDDEHTALPQAGQRVGVAEHGRVRRQHDVDVDVLAVHPDRLRRRRQVVGRRLALLLRAVLRVGLDLPAEQLEQRHRQVLAGRHRAPAADRVHAHRDRALGHQVRVLAAAHDHVGGVRVAGLDRLLVQLVLRVRRVAGDVDRDVEERLLRAARQHVLDGADQRLGLQVARAQAEAARVQPRHLLRRDRRVVLVRLGVRAGQAVLQRLGQRGAQLAHQRQVLGQRLVGALHHDHALLAAQRLADQVARERTEHRDVQHADLQLARLAQVVGDGLGLHDHAAHADDDVLGVLQLPAADAAVAAAGQLGVFGHALLGQRLDRVEEVRPLRGDGLHVGVLVLHRARQQRHVDVPDRRHAAALRAVDHGLRRRRRVDQVVRTAEVLGDELALGDARRLDQVGRQEAVLADDGRGQRQLGELARDQVQVGGLGGALGHHLDEAGVVDAVVVVVAGVHVQAGLGDRAAAHVQHVGQALADRRVQRLVHEGDALARREVGRAQAGHRHAGGDAGGGVLGLGLDEDQRPVGDVQVAGGHFLRPVLAHLRRRRDRVGAGGVGGLALDHDDGGVAVDGVADAGVLDRGGFVLAALAGQVVDDLLQHSGFLGSDGGRRKSGRAAQVTRPAAAAARGAGSSWRRGRAAGGRGRRTRRSRRSGSGR